MSFAPPPPVVAAEIALPGPEAFGPTPRAERIGSIDFVRGVALLGILLVNSAFLFGPMGLLFEPALLRTTPAVDRVAYAVVVGACQGKFIALFSLLFGYGLLGQIEKAAAAGRSPARFAFRRLGTLAVFGLIHALFLWYGDVLFIYACIGGWLLLARGGAARNETTAKLVQWEGGGVAGAEALRSPGSTLPRSESTSTAGAISGASKTLSRPRLRALSSRFATLVSLHSARKVLIAAVVLLLISILIRGGLELVGAVTAPFSDTPTTMMDGPRGLKAMREADWDPSKAVWLQAEVRAYRYGPWSDAQTFRMVEWLYNLFFTVLAGFWHVLGMFLVGGAFWRLRFFAPEQRAFRRRIFLTCLPIGLALEAAAAWCYWGPGLTDRYTWAAGSAIQAVSVCVLPLGYLGGLALLADRLPGWLRAPVANAGRMALTVYLLETFVATFFAYHWGLGWFGRLGVLQEVLLSLAVWAGLVLFSSVYLRFFERGPMEALWRRLEYGKAATARPVA